MNPSLHPGLNILYRNPALLNSLEVCEIKIGHIFTFLLLYWRWTSMNFTTFIFKLTANMARHVVASHGTWKGTYLYLFREVNSLVIMKTIQKDMLQRSRITGPKSPRVCLCLHVNKKHWREQGPRLQGAADQDVHGWMMHVPDWWQHAYVMHHSLMTKWAIAVPFVLRSGQR